jgi:hypothetical protein
VLAVWVAAALLAYAFIWRVSATETAATALFVVIGISLGLLTLYIRYNPQNVLVVVNPLEQLFTWAKNSNPELSAFLPCCASWRRVCASYSSPARSCSTRARGRRSSSNGW